MRGDEEPYSCCEETLVGKEVPSKIGAGTPPTDPRVTFLHGHN